MKLLKPHRVEQLQLSITGVVSECCLSYLCKTTSAVKELKFSMMCLLLPEL